MDGVRPTGGDWLADNFDYMDSDDDSVGDSDVTAEYEALGPQKHYNVLSKKDIVELEEDLIAKVSTILAMRKEEACFLLNYYEWDMRSLLDDWFEDEQQVRDTAGLLINREDLGKDEVVCGDIRKNEVLCGICFDMYSSKLMSSVGCSHQYCHNCWKGYLGSQIGDGPRCLSLRCPDPSCNAMVHQAFINKLAKDEDKKKYERFILHAYVESRMKNTKWCPAPGCPCAVEFLGGNNYTVSCSCSHRFCWNCTEEAHIPVNCEKVAKWNSENNSETHSTNWLLANTKPCPKCKRTIQKDLGCEHMKCPCGFHFCWLCQREYTEHNDFYSCNVYESEKKQGLLDEVETKKGSASKSIDKYIHYYSHWTFSEEFIKRAKGDLQKLEKDIPYLADVHKIPTTRLTFMSEAWSSLIECRLILKWSYVYGYYLDDNSDIELFNFMQGEAEVTARKLHLSAEDGLRLLLSKKQVSKDWFDGFQVDLRAKTSATRKCFENFSEALVAGLEVDRSSADMMTALNLKEN